MTAKAEMSRRMFVKAMAAATASSAFASMVGCGSKRASEAGSGSGSGDFTITFAQGADPRGLDPAYIDDGESAKVMVQVYENLLKYKDKNCEVEPGLAKSYDVSDDGLTYTFKLRKGIKFQDGADFNAAAVKKSIGRQLEPDRTDDMPYAAFTFGSKADGTGIESIETPDDYTVVIKLRAVSSAFLANLAMCMASPIVSPKAIPQMRDAAQVTEHFLKKYPDLDLFALIPNYRGAKNAFDLGMKKVTNVISLSVSHNKANINRTHDESFTELEKIKTELPGLDVCLDVATAFGCPFEGKYYDVKPLLAFEQRAYDLGIRTMNLCDTVGMADPKQVREFVQASMERFPDVRFEIHIHDTRGMGLVNTLAGIEAGVAGVQSGTSPKVPLWSALQKAPMKRAPKTVRPVWMRSGRRDRS